jgi:hypothetical protein
MNNQKLKALLNAVKLEGNEKSNEFVDLTEELSAAIKGGMGISRLPDALDIACDGTCDSSCDGSC